MAERTVVVGPEGRPYSRVVRAGTQLWLAGVVPARDVIERGGGITEQTEAVLETIRGLLAAAGARMEDVVRTGVFITDAAHFEAMNEVYRRFFPKDPPVRTTVVSGLVAKGALVEIESVALLPG